MNTPKLEGICVLVDGGCLNNNRPVSERSMYGSLTVYYNGKRVESTIDNAKCLVHRVEIEPNGAASNNIAEVTMVMKALNYVVELMRRSPHNLHGKVTILSDSELALGLVSGAMKPGGKTSDEWKRMVGVARDKAILTGATFQHVDNLWVKTQLGH
jgi:ribonuclease HI